MADNFFGFDSDFPSGISVLGKLGLDEELLTDEVEDEYDALNDETFGRANNDDWEDAHEKLADLIKNTRESQSIFNDSLLETDESQDEIVSKSISQLGLEDDLDDPAIMTISRNYSSSGLRSAFGPSPPPPAILETEICGSPKTHSIWSTTPKDSGIASFLNSIGRSSGSFSHQDTQTPLNSSSDNVFSSPPQTKAWRVEELEKDLLSSTSKGHVQTSNSDWPQIAQLKAPSHQSLSNKSPPSQFPNVNNLNKINHSKMLTREEVERHMHSDPRMTFPPKTPNYISSPFVTPIMRPNILTPNIKNLTGSPLQPPTGLRHPRGPMLGGNGPVPDRPFMPFPYGMNPRMNNMVHNQLPLRGPPLPPGFNPPNINLNQPKIHNMPRTITHPLINKQFLFPFIVPNKRFVDEYCYENECPQNSHNMEDEYADLMTTKEKEWLLRIQLSLLKLENPYVEDYYYTTQVARRCRKRYMESALKEGGQPELIYPEISKHENKTYVPTQFEGSLGKLQAVSVNFPRKVLDITIAKPPEEGKVVPSLSLMRRHRRLLFDIEKLYNHFLNIEDEKRKILAKPSSEAYVHTKTIETLKKAIFTGFFCDNSSDENFQNIMTIRKGRTLIMRSLEVFNMEQKVHCLCALFRCLPQILKKDQDSVLFHHCNTVTDIINECLLADLVKLGGALENDISPELSVSKDRSNFPAALESKFGSSVICSMITRAENLYCGYELFESDIQSRWAKIVLHLVETMCNLINSSVNLWILTLCNYSKNFLVHFQRFDVNKDQLEMLKEKLLEKESNSNGKTEDV